MPPSMKSWKIGNNIAEEHKKPCSSAFVVYYRSGHIIVCADSILKTVIQNQNLIPSRREPRRNRVGQRRFYFPVIYPLPRADEPQALFNKTTVFDYNFSASKITPKTPKKVWKVFRKFNQPFPLHRPLFHTLSNRQADNPTERKSSTDYPSRYICLCAGIVAHLRTAVFLFSVCWCYILFLSVLQWYWPYKQSASFHLPCGDLR